MAAGLQARTNQQTTAWTPPGCPKAYLVRLFLAGRRIDWRPEFSINSEMKIPLKWLFYLILSVSAIGAINPALSKFDYIVIADDVSVYRDNAGLAALNNANNYFSPKAIKRGISIVGFSRYRTRNVSTAMLKTGRDRMILAIPSFSSKEVGTLQKKIEVLTTVWFNDALTGQQLVQKQSTKRNRDWSQAFQEGLKECFDALLDDYPGFDATKSFGYQQNQRPRPTRDALLTAYSKRATHHPMEGEWRIETPTAFGQFDTVILSELNTVRNEDVLMGYISNPLYSGRNIGQFYLSLGMKPKNEVYEGLISEDDMALTYNAQVTLSGDTLKIRMTDSIWGELPALTLVRLSNSDFNPRDEAISDKPPADLPAAPVKGSGSGFLG
jgi:hypothetical protein